jgi:hypothetical protein
MTFNERMHAMKLLLALGASLVLVSAAAIAGGDSFSGEVAGPPGPPPASLYDRIQARYAHLNRDVEEDFRDGPCRVERRWERDGDFEERITCRGPND